MQDSPVTLKSLILTGIISLLLVAVIFVRNLSFRNTEITVCDVGQGNATHIRIGNLIDILIDAGPDRTVLQCIGNHMPFYDREIELIIITHSDIDHYGGARHIIDRYKVGAVIIHDLEKNDKELKKLKQTINLNGIPIKRFYSGDKITIDNILDRIDRKITFLWPTVDFDIYGGNDSSSILSYDEGGFRLLFTGDSTPEILNRLTHSDVMGTDVLMVPHHGSRNGLTEKLLRLADPDITVISVGKNNPYGHPSKSILDLIEAKKINIKRTDKDGDIVFRL